MKIRSSLLSTAALIVTLGTTSTFFISGTASALLPVEPVRAEISESRVNERAQTAEQRAQDRNVRAEERIEQREERAEERAIKLEANKLRICEKRQGQITSIMQNIAKRGVAQVAVFDKIADRTKEFYATKGYYISEFTTLASEVDAKYDAALVASNETVALSETWTCSMDDPKGNITALREAKTAEVAALKEYKTSIRNLIVAVKSASIAANDAPVESESDTQATSTTGEAQ